MAHVSVAGAYRSNQFFVVLGTAARESCLPMNGTSGAGNCRPDVAHGCLVGSLMGGDSCGEDLRTLAGFLDPGPPTAV